MCNSTPVSCRRAAAPGWACGSLEVGEAVINDSYWWLILMFSAEVLLLLLLIDGTQFTVWY